MIYTVHNSELGRVLKFRRRICPHCYGRGELYRILPEPRGYHPCGLCRGTGRYVSRPLRVLRLTPAGK